MDYLTPAVTGALLAVFTVLLHLLVKGQIDGLRREFRGEIDGLKREIGGFRGEVDGLRGQLVSFMEYTEKRFDSLDRRVERLESAVASLRADLTQIALAVGANLRPETG